MTGLSSSSSSIPIIMRYASSISLEISQKLGFKDKIYPPVLTIEYTEMEPPLKSILNKLNPETVVYQVQARYTMNLSSFFTILYGFFIGGIVLFILIFILQYLNWSTRNKRNLTQTVSSTSLGGLNSKVILELIIMLIHSFNVVFFPFTVLVAWYIFVFFKLQSFPAVLLPPMDDLYSYSSPYYPFTVMMYVLTFFQLGYIIILVYKQSNSDIFFLDWEPSKYNNSGKNKKQNGNVSIWRTILVANEYAEMQTIRKTDIKFTLFFLVFILIGNFFIFILCLVLCDFSYFF